MERIRKIFHRIDTADQTVKKINIETITQNQTHREVISETLTEIVHIQTIQLDII